MIFLWIWLLILWLVLAGAFVIKYREWKRWDKERRAELSSTKGLGISEPGSRKSKR